MRKLLWLLLFPLVATGQTTKPVAQAVTNQTATTKDGKTVVLKSNGTWEYSPAANTGLATLALETGVVFKSGDVKPVARTTFYLLDEDLGKLLIDAGVKMPKDIKEIPRGTEVEHMAFAYGMSAKYKSSSPKYYEFFVDAKNAITPHIKATTMTDFSGKATFEPLSPKTYFVFAFAPMADSHLVWSYKVELKPGQNSVVLDQNNAVPSF